jgi:putative redox protein
MTSLLITLGENARVDARFGSFTIHTDQTVGDGGDESAPSPFDLFLASLGTCAGYFVQAFCRERDLPTDGIRLVEHVDRDDTIGMIVKISLEIQLPPSFPEKYRTAVVRAAGQCSVRKHLQQPPEVEVTTSVA